MTNKDFYIMLMSLDKEFGASGKKKLARVWIELSPELRDGIRKEAERRMKACEELDVSSFDVISEVLTDGQKGLIVQVNNDTQNFESDDSGDSGVQLSDDAEIREGERSLPMAYRHYQGEVSTRGVSQILRNASRRKN